MGFKGAEGSYSADVYDLARALLDALERVTVADRTSREAALHPLLADFATRRAELVRDIERKAHERATHRDEQTIKGLREQLEASNEGPWTNYAAHALASLIAANETRPKKKRRAAGLIVADAADYADRMVCEKEAGTP